MLFFVKGEAMGLGDDEQEARAGACFTKPSHSGVSPGFRWLFDASVEVTSADLGSCDACRGVSDLSAL
jgi:hypothetical protein